LWRPAADARSRRSCGEREARRRHGRSRLGWRPAASRPVSCRRPGPPSGPAGRRAERFPSRGRSSKRNLSGMKGRFDFHEGPYRPPGGGKDLRPGRKAGLLLLWRTDSSCRRKPAHFFAAPGARPAKAWPPPGKRWPPARRRWLRNEKWRGRRRPDPDAARPGRRRGRAAPGQKEGNRKRFPLIMPMPNPLGLALRFDLTTQRLYACKANPFGVDDAVRSPPRRTIPPDGRASRHRPALHAAHAWFVLRVRQEHKRRSGCDVRNHPIFQGAVRPILQSV